MDLVKRANEADEINGPPSFVASNVYLSSMQTNMASSSKNVVENLSEFSFDEYERQHGQDKATDGAVKHSRAKRRKSHKRNFGNNSSRRASGPRLQFQVSETSRVSARKDVSVKRKSGVRIL